MEEEVLCYIANHIRRPCMLVGSTALKRYIGDANWHPNNMDILLTEFNTELEKDLLMERLFGYCSYVMDTSHGFIMLYKLGIEINFICFPGTCEEFFATTDFDFLALGYEINIYSGFEASLAAYNKRSAFYALAVCLKRLGFYRNCQTTILSAARAMDERQFQLAMTLRKGRAFSLSPIMHIGQKQHFNILERFVKYQERGFNPVLDSKDVPSLLERFKKTHDELRAFKVRDEMRLKIAMADRDRENMLVETELKKRRIKEDLFY